MLHLVDGYNVTRSDPATRGMSLEEQREALVARLRVRGRDLLGAGRIVVVFDGQGGAGVSVGGGSGPVEVRFSREGSADDEIVRLAAAAERESVCLVTSDAALAARARERRGGARGTGFEVRPREILFEATVRGGGGRRRRTGSSAEGVPAGGNLITAELKTLWLDEEDSREKKKE